MTSDMYRCTHFSQYIANNHTSKQSTWLQILSPGTRIRQSLANNVLLFSTPLKYWPYSTPLSTPRIRVAINSTYHISMPLAGLPGISRRHVPHWDEPLMRKIILLSLAELQLHDDVVESVLSEFAPQLAVGDNEYPPKASLLGLPEELLCEILYYMYHSSISRESLLNSALTCQLLHRLVMPFLYCFLRNVNIEGVNDFLQCLASTVANFLELRQHVAHVSVRYCYTWSLSMGRRTFERYMQLIPHSFLSSRMRAVMSFFIFGTSHSALSRPSRTSLMCCEINIQYWSQSNISRHTLASCSRLWIRYIN